MYKIYINDNILVLANREIALNMRKSENCLIAPYTGKKKMLLSYLDMLEKGSRIKKVILHHYDYKKLKADFKSLFETVKAAGGVVANEKNEILAIFRRGHWDLPKGKLEVDETKKAAAIREVSEETGAKNLELVEKILKTRHFYRTKSNRRAIKLTHWYALTCPKQELIPQTGEDIEKAVWMYAEALINTEEPIFKNIIEVVETYIVKFGSKANLALSGKS